MTQKIDFFKVRDIDTPIQPRKKKHQTNVSSSLKTFWDHLRRLWDNHKILDFCPPKTRFCRNSCRNVQREGKNPKFSDYLKDPASYPKTFLGAKYHWFDVSFYVVGLVYRYLGLWKNSIFCLMSNFWRFQLSHFGAKFCSWICGLFVCSHRACRIFYGPKSIQNLSNDI